MKTVKLLWGLLFLLATINLAACSDDEPQDTVKTIKMFISAETSTYQPFGSDHPIDCMLVKEEGKSEYTSLDFLGISGFDYEKGYEYFLSVEKKILSNPPADGSSIAYTLINTISKVKIEYVYRIEINASNPFLLEPYGGMYQIPFVCKRAKYADGELQEDEYASLKGLKYSMYTNYGEYTNIVKDEEEVGHYRFMIEAPEYYNMKGTPQWYYGIYPADADLLFGPEPEPIFKQWFEQPQTEGEDYFIYPIIHAATGTFDI